MTVPKVNGRLAALVLVLLVAVIAGAQPRGDRRGSRRAWPPGTSDYAKSDFIEIEVSPQRCRVLTAAEGFRDCGGIAGYRLLYRGPEEKPEIIVAAPGGKRFSVPYWNLNAGNFVALAKSVEWRFIRHESRLDPLVLILDAAIKPEEFVRFDGPYTIIVKLTPTEVCPIGRVPTSPYSGGDMAQLISSARSRKCVGLDDVTRKDWLGVVFGLTANGRYEEAKSVIPQMKSSGERVFAYKSIAEAQAASGDLAAARSTLLQGLEEAHRPLTGLEDEFTLFDPSAVQHNIILIAYAFASAGLYDDLRATEKLIGEEHLVATLVTIAKIQGGPAREGGRMDLESAKATLQRAIEIEMTRQQDVNALDTHLVNIADAQAELGFLAEARKTVELIKSPSAREAAEHAISWRTKLRRP